MKSYVLAVAGMAMLTAIISVVMPRKKFAKTIEGILKLCMILTLVAPILGFMRQDTTFFLSDTGISAVDGAYINNSYALALEREIEGQFGVTVRAEVEISGKTETDASDAASANGETKIRIYIEDFGMNDEEEHINIITQIAETAKKLLETDNVEVYDGTA